MAGISETNSGPVSGSVTNVQDFDVPLLNAVCRYVREPGEDQIAGTLFIPRTATMGHLLQRLDSFIKLLH